MSKQREANQGTWTALAGLAGMIPGVQLLSGSVARNTVQRLLGFWVIYHMAGGLEAGIESGVMSQSSGYRQRAEFLEVFGMSVDDFAPDISSVFSKVVRDADRPK